LQLYDFPRLIWRKLNHCLRNINDIWRGYTFVSYAPEGQLVGFPEEIGKYSFVDYSGSVSFGKNVKIGYGVVILSSTTIVGKKSVNIIRKPVIIGDSVEIGSNVVILPGVTVGSNSTIGANSLVNKNIPESSMAFGSPARIAFKK